MPHIMFIYVIPLCVSAPICLPPVLPSETVHTKDRQCSVRWISDESLNLPPFLCCFSLGGVPSLESHSPCSPFTHHEEKTQNMRCASLILQLPSATASSVLRVHCHLSSPDIWQRHHKETLYLWCDIPSRNEKILLLKCCLWHFRLMKGFSISWILTESPKNPVFMPGILMLHRSLII